MEKTCKKCKILKNIEDFYKSSYSKDGRQKHCISCIKEKQATPEWQAWKRDYRVRNLARCRQLSQEAGERCRRDRPVVALLRAAKQRSRLKGWACFLTTEDLGEIPDVCPVLGIKLESQAGRATDNSPSIDRIDNTRPYEKGNIAIISQKANLLKGDGTIEDFERLIQYMKSRLPCAV
jgi:hypothetical protein